jgi:hypothetical protein
MLVVFGLLFFGALGLAVVLERNARARKDIEVLKRVYSGFIPLPWILGAMIFLNGRMDSQKNIEYHTTTVVSRFYMRGMVRGSRRLVVRSWRNGQKLERLAVDVDDFDRFREGDTIVVAEEPGVVNIPWYYGAYRK